MTVDAQDLLHRESFIELGARSRVRQLLDSGSFRELIDLHVLTTTFGGKDGHFWTALVDRAREQGLGRPLYYAIRTLRAVLETPIPESTLAEIETFAPHGPVKVWMTRTLRTVLRPTDPAPSIVL